MRKPKSSNKSNKTTAELLKEAAVSLFGKYGYEGTSVRLIAKRAGVTAGQITANFGSKEKLFNEIVMDIYMSTCKYYDPIIGEHEYLKSQNLCSEQAIWRLIEKIIDTQIDFVLNLKNMDAVKIINTHMFNENVDTSAKLAQLTKSKIEDTLADMLREVFKQKKHLHSLTISRAVNGAIVSFAEHPDLLFNQVLHGKYMPQSKVWMKEYLKNFIMDSLRNEALKE
jgi:AcrR family transcriptional regulator